MKYPDLAEILCGRLQTGGGPYRLASGRESHYYLDARRALLTPRALKLAAHALAAEIRREAVPCHRVGGPGVGGGLLAAAMLCVSRVDWFGGLQGFAVRRELKGHGFQGLIEGDVKGRACVLVDDVATSGGTLIEAARALEGAGARVTACVVVVDRMEGARQALRRAGFPLFLAALTVRELGVRGVGDSVADGGS